MNSWIEKYDSITQEIEMLSSTLESFKANHEKIIELNNEIHLLLKKAKEEQAIK